ncbi:MAG: AAA family ATPase [Lachnospiraceae bacterium]|nr:AAA family ATPase [Lachnospiraceae bacterium]
MLIQIPETGVIKKQKFDIGRDVSIIYGYNNCGKTTILKAMDRAFHSRLMEQFILGRAGELAIYIPTNRIIVSESNTDELRLKDCEEFIHYQQDSYKDYSLHLKRLRDQLLTNKVIHNFICHAIDMIFEIDIKEISVRYSDGIENIINIYLNVIWAMTWDMDISCLTEETFCELLSKKQIYVMIDEIEMFLHVNIQARLISSMKEDFTNCSFIFTTHSPLLLTRYRQCMIYNIKNGKLHEIEEDVYYEDLDIIYEQFFEVEELPLQVREDINYLGNIILRGKDIDEKRVGVIAERLKEGYPNLYRRYNKIITKAQVLEN